MSIQMTPGYTFFAYEHEPTARRIADAWTIMGLLIAELRPTYDEPDVWLVEAVGSHDDRDTPSRYAAIEQACRDVGGSLAGGESSFILDDDRPEA